MECGKLGSGLEGCWGQNDQGVQGLVERVVCTVHFSYYTSIHTNTKLIHYCMNAGIDK